MNGPQTERRTGLASTLREERFSAVDAVGGPRGAAESILPTLLFLVLSITTGSIPIAVAAAGAVVLVCLVARLVQRQSVSGALGGLIGVALGAVLALRSGRGSDFYAPGIAINAVALAVLLVSLAVRRPLVGTVAAALDARVRAWREDPRARRAYGRATWLFAGLYAAKLLVQVPLLLSGSLAALGMAKLAMGLPAFAVIAYLVWLMHRSVLARLDPPAEESAESHR